MFDHRKVVAVMNFSSKRNDGRDFSSPLAHSVDDVVHLCGIGRTLVFAEIREGKLIARKCGRRTVVLDADLRRWLSSLPSAVATGGAAK
jgi:hypothetical protein